MIKIYTFADKRPDFIYKQKILFEKFVEDKFEFIIVNAASNLELKKIINQVCEKLNLNVLNFPVLNVFSPKPACSKPIQWCWDNYISNDNDNISVIIDSDIFMLNKFNFENYLGDNDICADYDKRGNINYIWNGLMIFSPKIKNKKEFNFSEGFVEGIETDVGGNLYYYIKKHNPKIKHIENIGYICSKNENVNLLPQQAVVLYDDSYLCEFFEQTFFHYRAGSNWNNKDEQYHTKKTKLLVTLIKNALEDKLTIPSISNYKFHELNNWWDVEWPTILNEYTRFINGRWTNG